MAWGNNVWEISCKWDDVCSLLVSPGECDAVSLCVPFDSSDFEVIWGTLVGKVCVHLLDYGGLLLSFIVLDHVVEGDDQV